MSKVGFKVGAGGNIPRERLHFCVAAHHVVLKIVSAYYGQTGSATAPTAAALLYFNEKKSPF